MNEDPYPRDGAPFYPTTPEVTVAANEEEKKLAAQSLPFIDGVLDWFDEVIASADSIAISRQYSKEYGRSYEDTAVAMDIARRYLEQKRGELQSLALTFKK